MPENKRLFPPKFPDSSFKLSRSPLFLPDCMRKRTKPNEQIKSGSPHITSKRYTSLKGTSVSKGNARNNKQKDNTPTRLPAIFGTVPSPLPEIRDSRRTELSFCQKRHPNRHLDCICNLFIRNHPFPSQHTEKQEIRIRKRFNSSVPRMICSKKSAVISN